MLGVGMMYFSLEHLIELVQPSQRKRVLEVLRQGRAESVEYEHALFACPKCDILRGRFDYQVVREGGTIIRPTFRCGRCRSQLKRADRRVTQYRCATCGAKSLTQRVGGLWD